MFSRAPSNGKYQIRSTPKLTWTFSYSELFVPTVAAKAQTTMVASGSAIAFALPALLQAHDSHRSYSLLDAHHIPLVLRT